MPSEQRAWSGRSHGGGLGTALVAAVARWGGRDLCYCFVLPPALWFCWRDHRARRAIMRYWQALYPGRSRAWARLRVPWHFWTFARGLADRFLDALSPGTVRPRNVNHHYIFKALEGGRGCILLSAHIGSFELSARWLCQGSGSAGRALPRINVVMLNAEDPRVQAALARSMGAAPYGLIDLANPSGAALAIMGALGRGEIVCMLGDRSAGSVAGTRRVRFLGADIRLPVGPFVAAASSGAPIVVTFCRRSGWSEWTCAADPPWHIQLGRRAEREQRLQACVQRWATRMALEVRRHPWAWNNYFDIWAAAADGPSAS